MPPSSHQDPEQAQPKLPAQHNQFQHQLTIKIELLGLFSK